MRFAARLRALVALLLLLCGSATAHAGLTWTSGGSQYSIAGAVGNNQAHVIYQLGSGGSVIFYWYYYNPVTCCSENQVSTSSTAWTYANYQTVLASSNGPSYEGIVNQSATSWLDIVADLQSGGTVFKAYLTACVAGTQTWGDSQWVAYYNAASAPPAATVQWTVSNGWYGIVITQGNSGCTLGFQVQSGAIEYYVMGGTNISSGYSYNSEVNPGLVVWGSSGYATVLTGSANPGYALFTSTGSADAGIKALQLDIANTGGRYLAAFLTAVLAGSQQWTDAAWAAFYAADPNLPSNSGLSGNPSSMYFTPGYGCAVLKYSWDESTQSYVDSVYSPPYYGVQAQASGSSFNWYFRWNLNGQVSGASPGIQLIGTGALLQTAVGAGPSIYYATQPTLPSWGGPGTSVAPNSWDGPASYILFYNGQSCTFYWTGSMYALYGNPTSSSSKLIGVLRYQFGGGLTGLLPTDDTAQWVWYPTTTLPTN